MVLQSDPDSPFLNNDELITEMERGVRDTENKKENVVKESVLKSGKVLITQLLSFQRKKLLNPYYLLVVTHSSLKGAIFRDLPNFLFHSQLPEFQNLP